MKMNIFYSLNSVAVLVCIKLR